VPLAFSHYAPGVALPDVVRQFGQRVEVALVHRIFQQLNYRGRCHYGQSLRLHKRMFSRPLRSDEISRMAYRARMLCDLAKGASVTATNRSLRPNEQLGLLSRIWGTKPGYVFLPWIEGKANTKEARKRGYHEGRAWKWPEQRDAILTYLNQHREDDVYFCPNKFRGKRRAEEQVLPERVMYADLDAVDPRKLQEQDQPTIAWQSSPNRYQGVWLMNEPFEGSTKPGGINHRLTYYLEADKSGWDSTQLLRVPGRPNHKPEYRHDGKPVEGKLLWANGQRYVWADWEEDLPEIESATLDDTLIDEAAISEIDRWEVFSRVKMKLSRRVRGFLRSKTVDGEDRSDVLWEIERELADAGCTVAEIVAITKASVWNKYAGRGDELKRLKTEAAKAVTETNTGVSVLGDDEEKKPSSLVSVNDLYEEESKPAKWLVKNIWTKGSVGFIAGAPKSYKSWFALDLAVSMATGMPFLNNAAFAVVGGKKRVLYIAEEDGVSLIRERLDYIIDAKDPHLNPDGWVTPERVNGRIHLRRHLPKDDMGLYVHVRKGFNLADESWLEWLEEMVETHNLDAVIIDTLSTTAGGVDIDKSSELMSRILNPLRQVSHRTKVAIALVHHNRKEASSNKRGEDPTSGLSDRAGRDMLGSVALHAWVDCALYVRAKRDVDSMPHLSGTDDEGRVVPVRGVEVYLERESKSAEDLKFRVMVPMMKRQATQTARFAEVFDVDVRMKWREPDASDHVEQQGNADDGRKTETSNGRVVPFNKAPAGSLLVNRLMRTGLKNEGVTKSLKEISGILGHSGESITRRQLNSAQESGWISRLENGEYEITKEGRLLVRV
jgi:hypothetical protein